MWFVFTDVSGGGMRKTDRQHTLIQASSFEEAATKFKRVTGFDAHSESCQCCGPDFLTDEFDTLGEARQASGVSRLEVPSKA